MKEKCGEKQDMEFQDEGVESITVQNLTFGDSCTYKIKSFCGSPAFQMKQGSKGVNITFIEFEGSGVNKTKEGKGNNTSPKNGMPARNSSFSDSGDQGKFQGQKKPPKKRDDGTVEDGEYIDGKDQFGQNDGGKRPGGGGGGSKTNTTERGGYGKPTKGDYNTTEGGYKTFGTEGQGENKKGLKGDKEECAERFLYITVTGNNQTASSDTILLEIGSYTFYDTAEMDSSVYIKATLVSIVLGLINLL
jgi:hypothetical protein